MSTSTLGHRLTGSRNGRIAEEQADSLFRASGFTDVRFFPFQAVAWQRGTIEVAEMKGGAQNHALHAVALALTPADADVTAELLDGGNGLAADLDGLGDKVRGRIVLMNLQLIDPPAGASNLHRSEKCALAIARGAAGILFVNNVDGGVLLTGTASVSHAPITVPAACIGKEDAAVLRERLRKGERPSFRLMMHNTIAPVTARNVIATLPGTDRAGEEVVVGAHLDSWDLATGATDNGLGSFSVLDMARCLAAIGQQPRRTIKFVLFMGEEQGLLGSTALVDAWKKSGELSRVKAMINLDMSGHPSGFNAVGPGGWEPLVKNTLSAMHALDTSFIATYSDGAGLHSDHQPFMLQGVPTLSPICDLGEQVYRFYHSDGDDIQLVDPQAMVNNVRRVGQLVWSLANTPDDLPPHFIGNELPERLKKADLEEELRIQKLWRW